MKKILIIAAITIGLSFSSALTAQNPPHPNGGGAPGQGNTPVGGSAPIENGTFILITLALAYTGRKVYVMRRPVEE
jgi:hypothetical protein